MRLDKHYHGALQGTSRGQMLTVGGEADGSGVYVAIERVTATIEGREGSFALHHVGVMTRGVPTLAIAVAPDSGTGGLAGIAGSMTIDIAEGGTHFYDFAYTLPAAS
jgi:hypothetical protein